MKLRINVEGKSYDVEVEVLAEGAASAPPAPLPPAAALHTAPVRAAAPAPAPAAAGTVNAGKVVRAPIIGTVTQVTVSAGDQVAVDDVIVVMEAMKMETKVATAIAARVKTVFVKAGDAVKSGQVLVEFD